MRTQNSPTNFACPLLAVVKTGLLLGGTQLLVKNQRGVRMAPSQALFAGGFRGELSTCPERPVGPLSAAVLAHPRKPTAVEPNAGP